MTDKEREVVISDAKKLWLSGNRDKSIDMLYEAIPLEKRSEWLGQILVNMRRLINNSPSIDRLIKLSEEDVDWDKIRPHPILYAITDEAYREQTGLNHHIHTIAYRIGKQVVNVQGYSAPFDHSNLFSVPEEMQKIAILTNDKTAFMESMWELLSEEQFIQLDKPIMCNPNCPLCMMRSGKINISSL